MVQVKTCLHCKQQILGEYVTYKVDDGLPPGTRNRWRTVGYIHEHCIKDYEAPQTCQDLHDYDSDRDDIRICLRCGHTIKRTDDRWVGVKWNGREWVSINP